MKIVYRTGDYTDALIKKGLLEQAGFLVQMGNQNFGSTEVALGMVDGFTLNVVDDDFDEVSALLKDIDQASARVQFSEADDDEDTAPVIGEGYLPNKNTMFWLGALALTLFVVFALDITS